MNRIGQISWFWMDHCSTGRQDTEEVVDGQIEVQPRKSQNPIFTCDAETLVDVFDGVDSRTVADRHAFWLPRGARGEDYVGNVLLVSLDT